MEKAGSGSRSVAVDAFLLCKLKQEDLLGYQHDKGIDQDEGNRIDRGDKVKDRSLIDKLNATYITIQCLICIEISFNNCIISLYPDFHHLTVPRLTFLASFNHIILGAVPKRTARCQLILTGRRQEINW